MPTVWLHWSASLFWQEASPGGNAAAARLQQRPLEPRVEHTKPHHCRQAIHPARFYDCNQSKCNSPSSGGDTTSSRNHVQPQLADYKVLAFEQIINNNNNNGLTNTNDTERKMTPNNGHKTQCLCYFELSAHQHNGNKYCLSYFGLSKNILLLLSSCWLSTKSSLLLN